MSTLTLEQVVRNCVEAENAAARFYELLADFTLKVDARDFLQSMCKLERGHAMSIERLGQKLGAGELPMRADDNVELIETAPAWSDVADITLSEALGLAIELEQHAELYYSALADATKGEISQLFARIAQDERSHLKMLASRRP
ncbi:MAG: ferritin family protein [Myxococcota bacterium]|jgi:rubrerythrin|nr:ferritin family protein [Myxococcota bacterium]